jgi:glycosyltransferase involved in cell wall biosynthesis
MIGALDRYFQSEVFSQEDVGRLIKFAGQRADNLLAGRDIYMVTRLFREKGLDSFLDVVHGSGGLAVFDTDDDLTEDFRELDSRGDEFIFTMKKMDAVTVSTPFLASRMEEYLGYSPQVFPNLIDFEWFSKMSLANRRQVDGLTVGLLGTASHYGDWEYPVDALVRLKEEFGDKVSILVAGYFPDYLRDIATKISPVPYSNYPALVRQFDIVCCSLDPDDMFNKSKSAVKALESMAAARVLSNGKIGGAVPVCTDMPVYRRVVGKKNGLLTANDEWYEPLRMLVEDKILREKLAYEGHKWVRTNRDSRKHFKARARFYRNLIRRKRNERTRRKAVPDLEHSGVDLRLRV